MRRAPPRPAACDPAAASPRTALCQVPALFKRVAWWARAPRPGRPVRNLDIGGGPCAAGTRYLAREGVKSTVYDPCHRTPAANAAALARAGRYDTVTVANVLNVIPAAADRAAVVRLAARALRPGGTAFFSVHEGDRSGRGGPTAKGWQANRRAASYEPELRAAFADVRRSGAMFACRRPLTR